jgi:endo-alpha-1,4-polygalactosaminidase (GH114 family)
MKDIDIYTISKEAIKGNLPNWLLEWGHNGLFNYQFKFWQGVWEKLTIANFDHIT